MFTFQAVLENMFHDHKEVHELLLIIVNRLPEVHSIRQEGFHHQLEDIQQVLALL